MTSVQQAVSIATGRRANQHEWRRAIRGQMPPTTFAVAQAVASYTNKDGSRAYPGNERLAADLCCTTKTIQRALKWLRENHWLQLDSPAAASGKGRKLAQEWSLAIPDWWTSESPLVDTGVHPPDQGYHQAESLTRAQPSVVPARTTFDSSQDAYDWIDEQVHGLDGYEPSYVDARLSRGDHPKAIVNGLCSQREATPAMTPGGERSAA